jgi:hypothetical protein
VADGSVPAVSAAQKPWAQRFVDAMRGEIETAKPASAMSYAKTAGATTANFAQAGIIGGLLGAAHAKWGLDSPGGPIDGWLAGLGWVGAVGLSQVSPLLAERCSRAGDLGFGLLAFRKSFGLVNGAPLAGTSLGGGATPKPLSPAVSKLTGVDPIVSAAAGLGG